MNNKQSLSRRKLLGAMATLGGATITSPLWAAIGSKRVPTPEQMMGPFYPIMRPLDQDMDLTIVDGQTGRAKGQIVHLVGRVLNINGEPISGAKIEIWQANAAGRYAHPGDINTAPLDSNFQGFATQVTDNEGRYRFKTIKPGAYPINPINPVNMRPPHIHFDVEGVKDRLVTQMYFPGEQLNEADAFFNELGKSKGAAIANVLAPTSDIEPTALLMGWDIILDKG